MKYLIPFFAALFLLAGLPAIAPQGAKAGEEATTWRAGDPVVYRFGCHDADALRLLAPLPPGPLPAEIGGRCFVAAPPLRALLVEWLDGPFRGVGNVVGSIWRIRDEEGDEVFILLVDTGGPHPATEGS